MQQRDLGETGVRVGVLGLGTWGLTSGAYGSVLPETQKKTVEAALDAGVTSFDMAPLWGDGQSETTVGEAIAGRRDEVQLVTRCGARWKDGKVERSFSPEALRADCEGSLKRLGCETIDVLLLHNPTAEVFGEDEVVETMQKLVEEGKARTWGLSTFDVDVGRVALMSETKVIALPYNLLHTELVDDLYDDLLETRCPVLGTSPLCYGLLSGNWSPLRTFGEGDHRRERWSSLSLKRRVHAVQTLRFMAKAPVPNMTSAALRYALTEEVIAATFVGARKPEHIQDAAGNLGSPPYLPLGMRQRARQTLIHTGA